MYNEIDKRISQCWFPLWILNMAFIVKYSTGNDLNLHANFILLVDNNGVFRSGLLRYCSHFFRSPFSHSPVVKNKLIRIVGAATSKVFSNSRLALPAGWTSSGWTHLADTKWWVSIKTPYVSLGWLRPGPKTHSFNHDLFNLNGVFHRHKREVSAQYVS